MLISEILFVAMSGEPIIQKQYRNLPPGSPNSLETFGRKICEDKKVLTPHFEDQGRRYYHIKRHNLYIVATTEHDISPILVIELLSRVHQLCKDFCGTVNEDSLQTNFILVQEVLDELIDNGYVQLASTEKIKPYVQSEPVPTRSPENLAPGIFGVEHRAAPSDASNRPVIRSKWDQEQRKNEIFLDVIERMTILIASNGSIIRCEVNGQINMKSFLVGCPEIKIGFNEDLTVGQDENHKGFGSTVNLDAISFHKSVKTNEFEETKMLTVQPPEGEFQVMSYQLHGDMPHGIPFRLYSYVKDSESKDLELGLKLRCEIPSSSHAVSVKLHVPVPKATTSISQQLSSNGQMAEFVFQEKKIIWTTKKMEGKSEVSAHFKLIGARVGQACKRELGPVALDFEISGFVCSNLQIRFLRVFDREQSYVPFRWVRYITTSDSYITKLN